MSDAHERQLVRDGLHFIRSAQLIPDTSFPLECNDLYSADSDIIPIPELEDTRA